MLMEKEVVKSEYKPLTKKECDDIVAKKDRCYGCHYYMGSMCWQCITYLELGIQSMQLRLVHAKDNFKPKFKEEQEDENNLAKL